MGLNAYKRVGRYNEKTDNIQKCIAFAYELKAKVYRKYCYDKPNK